MVSACIRSTPGYRPELTEKQEVNPSLLDPVSIEQTVAVGCSLARAALGETLL
jgi:hypothetical protein